LPGRAAGAPARGLRVTSPPGVRRGLGAAVRLAVTAALLGGFPYALARLTGWPLPRRLPGWRHLRALLASPLSEGEVLKVLACAVWLAWVVFALSVLAEAAAAAGGWPAPRLPGIGAVQALASALLGATVLTSLQLPQAAARSAQPLHAVLTASSAAAGPRAGRPAPVPAARPPRAAGSRGAAASRPRVYRVVPGDDLWSIAARFLGTGEGMSCSASTPANGSRTAAPSPTPA